MEVGRPAAASARSIVPVAAPTVRRRSRRRALRTLLIVAPVLGGAASARAGEYPLSTVIFGSLEAGPSGFVTVGAKVAADRIDRDGFVALASLGTGRRGERGPSLAGARPTILTRWTMLGAALAGYQWGADWGVVALFAGPEGSIESLSGPGGAAFLPARPGLRIHGEVWARPSEDTLLTATLILGSARGHAWGRLSYGWRAWGASVGPEAALYVDETGYRKTSLGLHATDLEVGDLRCRVSAGVLMESGRASAGPYVSLTLWRPL
ncbi:hypothetical protein ASG40_02085 [Methylobacterium sp. Leaf399]|nr:hypothetical protein ASG40_02085 [Methylobacterium sp. Leaf399]